MNTIAIYRARAPYVSFLFALMMGIMVAMLTPVSLYLYRFICFLLAAFILLFVAFTMARVKYKNARLFGITGISFLMALLCLGWLLVWRTNPLINKKHFSHQEAAYLLGYISSEPRVKDFSLTAEFTVTNTKEKTGEYKNADGKLLLTIRTLPSDNSWGYGDELLLSNKYTRIDPPYNPHEFDYAHYMINNNVWHRSYLSAGDLVKTGNIKGKKLIRDVLSLRRSMVHKFSLYFRNEEALSMMSTLVLGYRATLDKELVKAFSSTGTIHVLAVSGMHVAIVFAFLSFSLRWMGKSRILVTIRLIIFILFIWGYALLTGFSASVLRAACMISFFIIGNTLQKERNTANNIAASAFFLLLYNPKYLTDVGFQLSYLAVIGIVWLTPMLMQFLDISNKFLKNGLHYAALSCGAQLATSPLVLYYFHLFPVYFLPANLFISLPASIMIYAGFFLLALPVNALTLRAASYLEQFITIVNQGLLSIEAWPLSTIKGVWLNNYEYTFLYLLLLWIIFTFKYRHKKLFYGMLGGLLGLGIMLNTHLWYRHASQQFLIFNVHRQLAIAMLDGNKPIVYADAVSMDDLTLQYSVMPAIEALSDIGHLSFIPEPARLKYGHMQIEGNVLQFMGKQLFIIDGNREIIFPSATSDWVLLRNNPQITLSTLNMYFKRNTLLIIDASNTKQTIKRFSDEASRLGIQVYCLKDNFAYVWDAKKQR